MAYSELRERKSKVEFGDVSTSKSFSKRAGPFPRVWRLYISTDALTLSHTMDYSLIHRHSECLTAGDMKTSPSPKNKRITLDDLQCCLLYWRFFRWECHLIVRWPRRLLPSVSDEIYTARVKGRAYRERSRRLVLPFEYSNMIQDIQCNFMDDHD